MNGDKPNEVAKVDQEVVNDAVNDLKQLLGRDPTPTEVEDYL